ncbi:MAG TPA: hypothetical protein VK759_09360 [Rhizomicrobium sp.]|nr:hypothetical protein [Rhizomicrobium sp.]
MSSSLYGFRARAFACGIVFASAFPAAAFACACGCAVFDVGTSTLLPSGPGGTAFLEYDFLNQTTNWSGEHAAPSANNDDKHIRSDFMLAGGQYMFDEDWGAMVEVPVTHRTFVTTDPDNTGTFSHTAPGDIRLMGVYSGFSSDMSSGLIAGVKLPTGDHTYAHFDHDVEIGSGSTDLLLGGYYTGAVTPDQSVSYFVQGLWQHELTIQDGNRPGAEINGAAGVSYIGGHIGDWTVSPIFQALVSSRGRDGGVGDRDNTGYTRLLVSPGVSVARDAWKLYADVEVPVGQQINGNQLIAPVALKFIASYSF